MTKEQINYSLETQRLKLSNWDEFSHYGIAIIFFIIPILLLTFYTKEHIQGTLKPLKDGEIWFTIGPLLLGYLLYRYQRKKLSFRLIETNLTREDLIIIIENTAAKLQWHQYINNEKVIVAKTFPGFFPIRLGERITIVFDKNLLLINSISNPEKRSLPVSLGHNKKNCNTLIENIRKANTGLYTANLT